MEWYTKPFIFQCLPDECGLPQDLTRVRQTLDMTNYHIGYVYVVDEKYRNKWIMQGNATDEEFPTCWA